MNKKISKGVWVKYDCEAGNFFSDEASCDRLYNDLKDTDVNWRIAKSLSECQELLCGEIIPCHGTSPGDVYVYYIETDGIRKPIFYIHVHVFEDRVEKQVYNCYLYNGVSLSSCYDLDRRYLPELIEKIKELDEKKDRSPVEELEKIYELYQKILVMQTKETYTEEDLLFLYQMAYLNNDKLALSILRDRDIKVDFEMFSEENRCKLYSAIKYTDLSKKLVITSRERLKNMLKDSGLSTLEITSPEIIDDKDFIMELLKDFFQSNGPLWHINKYLPEKYKIDIEVLECLIYCKPNLIKVITSWFCKIKELTSDSNFAYRIIDAVIRELMNRKEHCRVEVLWEFSDEIIRDIEDHILIGPEPTEEREKLRAEYIQGLQQEKPKIYTFRNRKKNNNGTQ